jgi:integral membrane protein (TIGR01906 family)
MLNVKSLLADIFISILMFFSTIILCIKLAINFRPLFYYDINYLNIPKDANMTVTDIKKNYDYLINFLNSIHPTNFSLPTLPSSAHGTIHFFDVYYLINSLTNFLYVAILIIIISTFIFFKHKKLNFLKYSGILLVIFPFLLTPFYFLNFDSFFNRMHEMIFHNNYWLFDPYQDPVILMLPEQFFFHCFILILILIVLFGVLLLITYRQLKKNFNAL